MGVVGQLAEHPVAQSFFELGLASRIGVLVAAFLGISIALNVAHQILFKNPNEPPVVFHWLPIIGSTITYGMDPPRFFQENRDKVSSASFLILGSC